jgi:prolyl-tRNA editing enzyme YbaK/EbsC (Cys-tRNA(Pro) deacylase)
MRRYEDFSVLTRDSLSYAIRVLGLKSEVGGVCPFGLKTPLAVYCDVSLKAFDDVVPAAGSIHSAVRIATVRMAELVNAEWIDVCEK